MLKLPWTRVDGTLFATVVAGHGRARYHMIAERLPADNGWDWTVWRPGDALDTARHGYAPGVVTAMAAAEGAARHWEAGSTIGSDA